MIVLLTANAAINNIVKMKLFISSFFLFVSCSNSDCAVFSLMHFYFYLLSPFQEFLINQKSCPACFFFSLGHSNVVCIIGPWAGYSPLHSIERPRPSFLRQGLEC